VTDPRELLPAARTDPQARLVLADRLRDDDGDTPAVETLLRPDCVLVCESCGIHETGSWMCWDQDGNWHYLEDAMNLDYELFHFYFGDYAAPPRYRSEGVRLDLYRVVCRWRGRTRWDLLCPHCHRVMARRLAAVKANATRAANRKAKEDAAPNLFTVVE
jgi:hypothetical protein